MLTVDILRNFTPLHTLTDQHLARLAKRVEVEDLAKGTPVCTEGDTDNNAIYLLEGSVEMRARSSSMTRVLQAGTPDAFFRYLPAFPGRTPSRPPRWRIFSVSTTRSSNARCCRMKFPRTLRVCTLSAAHSPAAASGWKRCWPAQPQRDTERGGSVCDATARLGSMCVAQRPGVN